MKKLACVVIVCGLMGLNCTRSAPFVTKDTSHQLTIELRDGSRIVGKRLDDTLSFHSAALGDKEILWSSIRSIEFTADNGTALLMATNGDKLTIQITADTLGVETAFGKTELPVKLIRSIRATMKGSEQLPAGLVALWSGEGDGTDSVGGNNATLTDITFVDGQVGQAFSFNGTTSFIKIPASPSLDVGAGGGFTLTAWIKPSDVNRGGQPILEWNNGGGDGSQLGVHFYITQDAGPGSLYTDIEENNTHWHQVHSRIAPLASGVFQFVALTYDKASGVARIYCNGTVVVEQNVGSFTPQTTYNLYLGKRPSDEGFIFVGLMDEVAIYNRALSALEIQTICRDQNSGEIPPPKPGLPVMPFNGIFRQSGFGGFSD